MGNKKREGGGQMSSTSKSQQHPKVFPGGVTDIQNDNSNRVFGLPVVFDRLSAVFDRLGAENGAKTIENTAETTHLNSTRTARPPKGPGSSSRIQMLKSSKDMWCSGETAMRHS